MQTTIRLRLGAWQRGFVEVVPASALRAFFQHPLFWGGLLLKLLLGATAASYYLRDLFVPFVNYFVESGLANPWDHFASLGRLNSFPYPPAMLYILAVPRVLLAPLLPGGTDTASSLHFLALRLPLLAADLGLALLLLHWFPGRARRLLVFYWCSPFVIYVAYWHGQLDLIPTALFVAGLVLVYHRRLLPGMAVYGLALATKSHLWVALPFVLVYVWQEHGWRRAVQGGLAAIATFGLLVLPHLPSPAFRQMVFSTQEQSRLFAFQLTVGTPLRTVAGGEDLAVLLTPGAIILLWFRFAGYARRNWDLFMLYLGILFSVFILLAPPAPGYFLWSLPFLMHFIARSNARASRSQALPYWTYAASYLAFFWLSDQSDLFDAWRLVSPVLAAQPAPFAWLSAWDPERAVLVQNGLFTLMQAALAGIVLNMYLVGVRSNAVYRMRTTPVLVGIAGDSGAGKSTLCRLLADLLGESRLTVINGDDYHRWPRGHEKWQVYTHLNIRGSQVHQQLEHAIAMHGGRSIVKGVYDHTTGQFTHPQEVDPSQYIVFSGLHALSLDAMRRVFDLKIFLDPDETLRRQWKTRRDQQERGHPAQAVAVQIERRQPDRAAYILPQRETADLILRVLPATALDCGPGGRDSDLAIEVQALNGYDLAALAEMLEAHEGLRLEFEPFLDSRWQRLLVAGELPAERLLALAEALVPNLTELTLRPQFANGANGLMQIVILLCLSQKLRLESGLW